MLDLSRPERFFILLLLITGLFCAGLSYYHKVNNASVEKINISESWPLIDVNKAGAEELERLPGIGPLLAYDIIAYRNRLSGFKNIEELMGIKGIGVKKFNKIKDLIIISE